MQITCVPFLDKVIHRAPEEMIAFLSLITCPRSYVHSVIVRSGWDDDVYGGVLLMVGSVWIIPKDGTRIDFVLLLS